MCQVLGGQLTQLGHLAFQAAMPHTARAHIGCSRLGRCAHSVQTSSGPYDCGLYSRLLTPVSQHPAHHFVQPTISARVPCTFDCRGMLVGSERQSGSESVVFLKAHDAEAPIHSQYAAPTDGAERASAVSTRCSALCREICRVCGEEILPSKATGTACDAFCIHYM